MFLVILLVILIFGFLVFVHELGHFWAAKKSGVGVEEFGFGFPPRVFGKKVGETTYSINLIPLGGFVKLEGENLTDTKKGSFGGASFGQKVAILLAGVTMNALTAFVILVGLCLTGLPPVIKDQFSFGQASYAQPKQVMAVGIEKGSPAERAGVVRGDLIVKGDGQLLQSEQDLLSFTKANAGKSVDLTLRNNEVDRIVSVQLRSPDRKNGFLGVTPFQTYRLQYDLPGAIVTAGGILGQLMVATLAAFGNLVVGLVAHGQVSEQVAGPVGIVVILSNIVSLGLAYVLVFVASISVSLAVINAMPLPALDGGRLVLVVIQKLTKRQLSQSVEGVVHLVGFAALILLMIVVTYFDFKRIG